MTSQLVSTSPDADHPPRIFWSWQSDYSEKTCRHFIRDALAEAIKAVADSTLEDAERPELDHATKNTRGMVDISASILSKIASAAIFVADLTPIGQSDSKKWLPNPNVMIEVGWAMHRPGWERVIGVLNTASGAQVEDLPFDIRHRLIITYDLNEEADKPTRKETRENLIAELRGAIEVNLGARAEEVSAALEIVKIEAKQGDPSVWASAGDRVTHGDAFGGARQESVALMDVPRSYMRIIPQGWKNGPPLISDLARPPPGLAVEAPSEGGISGNFGATPEGFVRYWIVRGVPGEPPSAKNMVMYFEETGEFWMLHGSVVEPLDHQLFLRDQAMLAWWSITLRKAFAFMDHFNAGGARAVEVGLFGVKDVRWYAEWPSDRAPARRNEIRRVRQSRDWSSGAQLAFLTDAYNQVRNLFARGRLSEAEVTQILEHWDPQRFS